MTLQFRRPVSRTLGYCMLLFVMSWSLLVFYQAVLPAQDTDQPDSTGPTAAGSDAVGDDESSSESGDGTLDRTDMEGIDIFSLIMKGGGFMIPIGLMSLVMVTFVIERSIGMRQDRVIPPLLVDELGELADSQGAFDPRQAYRVCQRNPSAAASVIRSMLVKVGRPQSEIEHAVAESSDREANRLYANVRWLNLAAAVTPLMGLLGTVWGMIRAFHDTTQLPAGRNKADFLAEGIYVALVTTLGGLIVAIPAAIFSHYFEGRVQQMFHEIDELLFSLMPQVERYEGRVRFSPSSLQEDGEGQEVEPPPEEPEVQAEASE
ncbi:MAG: MotA/TolQ/ExbB proton channel family protein [Planctomycetota bacterium]|nr:MotA/TolQ/ExbB proton channel family protein [Planctomycetota bacterium]